MWWVHHNWTCFHHKIGWNVMETPKNVMGPPQFNVFPPQSREYEGETPQFNRFPSQNKVKCGEHDKIHCNIWEWEFPIGYSVSIVEFKFWNTNAISWLVGKITWSKYLNLIGLFSDWSNRVKWLNGVYHRDVMLLLDGAIDGAIFLLDGAIDGAILFAGWRHKQWWRHIIAGWRHRWCHIIAGWRLKQWWRHIICWMAP